MYSEKTGVEQRSLTPESYVALRLSCENVTGQSGEVVDEALLDTITGTAIELCKEFTGIRFAHIHAREISLISHKTGASGFSGSELPAMQTVSRNIFRELSQENGYGLSASFIASRLELNSQNDLFLYVDDCRGKAIEYSVNKAVEALYPEAEFVDKNTPQRMSMLFNTKYCWGKLPESFRFGQYIKQSHNPRTMKPMWVTEPALFSYENHRFTD